jgi:hypothetical protein
MTGPTQPGARRQYLPRNVLTEWPGRAMLSTSAEGARRPRMIAELARHWWALLVEGIAGIVASLIVWLLPGRAAAWATSRRRCQ